MRVRWVVERGVFGGDYALPAAAAAAGHEVTVWDDGWWQTGLWPRAADEAVVFHGSLGNADRVRRELPWRPGAFCATEAFRCSAWYPRAARWLVHETWSLATVRDLVARPPTSAAVFVRPDSPLKPFSGRVVRSDGLSLASLDHGFYYDDLDLPIVVAPVREVGREWRFVVVEGDVVAGSGYQADGRRALANVVPGADPWRFSAEVARELAAPEPVYVLDVGVVDGALRLLELNPFSGADLYGCDATAVVTAVSPVVARMCTG